ncbi:unnamed protein product [Linum trigynum]|uniref:Uncharacterized protein n=1 Tax=Linum trigynum TaxID=586398 RepID=A0AAV2F820_9ROSI
MVMEHPEKRRMVEVDGYGGRRWRQTATVRWSWIVNDEAPKSAVGRMMDNQRRGAEDARRRLGLGLQSRRDEAPC